ncbi:hypothetical protein KBD75_01370 [Candidatus Woesebacteria bacterium]|nr:hypothetical protein [Candidatus Woesebacteria bacterium]
MSKPTHFDVLIVYNGTTATSASDRKKSNVTPFPIHSKCSSRNNAYAYFLESCVKQGLKAAFSTSNDIIGPGLCLSYWTYKNTEWHRSNKVAYSTTIFDKFSPRSKAGKLKHQLLFSSNDIRPFNNPTLRKLFSDKQNTYNSLKGHAIPTIPLIGKSLANMTNACSKLSATMSTHYGNDDFSSDIIMKDRYGAGGYHVYKFSPGESIQMHKITTLYPDISFILQPFANSSEPTDIRLVYLGGKIVDSYIRVAKQNDFRCNEHQGGTLTYLDIKNIPKILILKANAIIAKLNNHHSLYSLDFMISDSGNPYLLEGNIGPGIDWNLSVKNEEVKAKKFIRNIVKNLSKRKLGVTPQLLQTA